MESPLTYLRVDGEILTGVGVRGLTAVEGLFGPPGVRGDVFDRPEADGVVEPESQYLPARIVILEGRVVGSTVAAAYQEFAAIDTALRNGLSGYVTVKWQPEGLTLELQGEARLAGPVLPRLRAATPGRLIEYQAMLRMADPVWYDQTADSAGAGAATSVGGIPFPIPFPIPFLSGASGGTVTVANAGNATVWPTITITGPINAPVVGNTATGEYLYFDTLNMVAGDTLTIVTNPFGRGATVAGSSVQGAIDWSISTWPSVAAGQSDVFQFYPQNGGTDVNTTLTVDWRDAYMTPE